ncbi:hypothetical protein VNO78_04841 [Psophocarpus tetragonolobus]|uniref:Uncharacterized protein n=1 Tax=Psophocarpus tetragonolobus TaxID=3891 RepID=A0AAN9T3G8_PSOTE
MSRGIDMEVSGVGGCGKGVCWRAQLASLRSVSVVVRFCALSSSFFHWISSSCLRRSMMMGGYAMSGVSCVMVVDSLTRPP